MHIGRGKHPECDAALVRHHDDPDRGAIQPGYGIRYSWQDVEVRDTLNPLSFGHLFVDYPVAVEKNRAHIPREGVFIYVGHTVMITTMHSWNSLPGLPPLCAEGAR